MKDKAESLLLIIVLGWFLLGFVWLWQRKLVDYVLVMTFLVVEFLFYLSTQVAQVMSGKRPLLHVLHPDDAVLAIREDLLS
jgi:Na+-translocating ferredoxin:NAD+ oxidoreductase RnfD subunit